MSVSDNCALKKGHKKKTSKAEISQSNEIDISSDIRKQELNGKKKHDFAYILAVDDSTFNLEALQLILNIHFKSEVDTAVSGKKSLLLVEERLKKEARGEKPYKLIFMDYSMPDMNGLETSKRIL